MGFPVPFAVWMKGEWGNVARDVLLDSRSRERGIIAPRAVERLLTAHASGEADGSDALWSLLNLELWYRTHIDGDGVQTLPGKPLTIPSDVGRTASDGMTCISRDVQWSAPGHEDSLAQCQPAAAARQGRQAAHLARDAAPRGAPRDHVSLVLRSRSAEGGSRRHARSVRGPSHDPAHGSGQGDSTLLRRCRAIPRRSGALRSGQVPLGGIQGDRRSALSRAALRRGRL